MSASSMPTFHLTPPTQMLSRLVTNGSCRSCVMHDTHIKQPCLTELHRLLTEAPFLKTFGCQRGLQVVSHREQNLAAALVILHHVHACCVFLLCWSAALPGLRGEGDLACSHFLYIPFFLLIVFSPHSNSSTTSPPMYELSIWDASLSPMPLST